MAKTRRSNQSSRSASLTLDLPTGTILPFGGDSSTVPEGFLMCGGLNVNRTDYAGLFSVIGSNWGNGDGVTTFTLPDLRGEFIRGTDDMGSGPATRDPNAAARIASAPGGNIKNNVGSLQDDVFALHNHGAGAHQHVMNSIGGGIDPWGSSAETLPAGKVWAQYYTVNGTSPAQAHLTKTSGGIITQEGGSETRPKNVYTNFIIKI